MESKATKEMELKKKKEVQPTAGEGTRPGPVYIPAVDILETQDEIVVLCGYVRCGWEECRHRSERQPVDHSRSY